jgi:hypothetical protein
MNSALLTFLCVVFVYISGSKFSGNSLASIIMTSGFAFFGINPVNMLPIMLGTYLYALLMNEPFSKHVHTGIWACCAGPVVQYMFVHGGGSTFVNVIAGIIAGTAAGFLIPPCASATVKAHEGMNLYNVGFASGIVLIVLSAILKGFGYTFEAVSSWYTEDKGLLTAYIFVLLVLWFIVGYILNDRTWEGFMSLQERSGQKCDFVALDGLGATMMNMALTGLIGTIYILVIGGDLSGPVISGIFSMFSFGAFGKNCRNVVWVLAGIVLLSFVSVWKLTDPAVQFSALLGTCICTFGGKYGPVWGMIAGMVHISIVRQSGSFHSWLNLYNNGFAGGVVGIFLLPAAKAFTKKD